MGGRGWAGWSGVKGWKWDNCNSIINKYIKKIKINKYINKNNNKKTPKTEKYYLYCPHVKCMISLEITALGTDRLSRKCASQRTYMYDPWT